MEGGGKWEGCQKTYSSVAQQKEFYNILGDCALEFIIVSTEILQNVEDNFFLHRIV
jgi:hypothetical protein